MNLEELKQIIEQQTNIPASLLTGETIEENIARAKSLLAYRREHESTREKSTGEQFSAWMNSRTENGDQEDAATVALAQIEEFARMANGGYPSITDGGETPTGGDGRPASKQFAEWFSGKNTFDPFVSGDGWKRLC